MAIIQDNTRQTPVAAKLALEVLDSFTAQLATPDRKDFWELVRAWIEGDDTAEDAMLEFLVPKKGTAQRMELPTKAEKLEKWVSYVGQQIRTEREKANLTQDELSLKAGLPQSHISKIETGRHSPTRLTLEKIAKALGLPVSTFDPSAEAEADSE